MKDGPRLPGATAEPNRRPMALRSRAWVHKLARRLAAVGVSPNAVSLTSILASACAAGCIAASRWCSLPLAVALLLLAPAFIAMRGICNLIDGVIAIEGGKKTAAGEVFNDFPDRVSDVVLFVGAGYGALEAAWGAPLGWLAAVLAIIVAYARMLGGAVGTRQFFTGPMAKPTRMLAISIACVAAAVERPLYESSWSLIAGLMVISAGCVVTTVRRLRQIIRELERG